MSGERYARWKDFPFKIQRLFDFMNNMKPCIVMEQIDYVILKQLSLLLNFLTQSLTDFNQVFR